MLLFSNIFEAIISLFLANPIAQTSGFLGMILVICAFIQEDDSHTIKLLMLANIFWGIHFIGLQSYAGLAAIFLAFLRLLLSLKYKRNIKVFYLLISLIGIFGVITYDGVISLLPMITSLIGAYGFIFLSGIQLRLSCLFSSFIWLTYHGHIGSIGGIGTELIVEGILLITIYKLSGLHGHRFHVADSIKHLIHFPVKDIDYGDYVIMRDKNKISLHERIYKKLLALLQAGKQALKTSIIKITTK